MLHSFRAAMASISSDHFLRPFRYAFAAALCALTLLTGCQSTAPAAELVFIRLQCNHQEQPTTVERAEPLFSWSLTTEAQGKSQSAWHLLVASTPDLLTEEDADLWNSGQVESAASVNVRYAGAPLAALQTYYWKVKIMDEAGQATDWSEPQSFTMGLLEADNWGAAAWISLREDTRTSPHRFRAYKTGRMQESLPVAGYAAGYFRKEMTAPAGVAKAEAFICGLGYYELYLNGEKVGDHVLDPAPSNYDKQAYYVKYDITESLAAGENAFGIIVGNGFYGQNISWKRDPESEKDLAYGPPAVKMIVKLTQEDGTVTDFVTDASWKESTGPIVFNNIYGGDTYDARFELGDWTSVGYDDQQWGEVKVTSPVVGRISAQQVPPIRRLEVLEPQQVFRGADGEWIVDFGQNIAGWIQLQVEEKSGQLIEIIPTEALLTNGKDIYPGSTGGGANGMPQLYAYICKGDGPENWEPKFSYHGFRYAKIKGISRKPDATMIKAVLVATDLKETGTFSCSDAGYNRMHEISKWTIVDNMHGIPEDCPHREKCGWLGDAHAFCEYALYNYDLYDFYRKYMEDISTQMRAVKGFNNPEVSFRAPTMIAPGKRTSSVAKIDWGVATMYLPWYNYRYYGDADIAMTYYSDMKILTQYYLSFKGPEGIMQDGMGDWCPPRWDRRKNPGAMECDPIISANAYFYDVLGIMEGFAELNEDAGFAAQMRSEKAALRKAFNAAFLVPIGETGHFWYGSQTATVQALQFGIVPEERIPAVVAGLVHDITEVKQGHHSTGIHGNRYIYTVLTRYGHAELAHRILTTPDFPSQTYVMNAGFTTWPERQFEWEKLEGPSNSLNHPMHSGFAAYFYESLGGIKPSATATGYREFTVNPQFPEAITATEVTVPTPYGPVKNAWKASGDVLTLQLEVPFNTTALLPLKQPAKADVQINGQSPATLASVTEEDETLRIGSGTYEITYRMER